MDSTGAACEGAAVIGKESMTAAERDAIAFFMVVYFSMMTTEMPKTSRITL